MTIHQLPYTCWELKDPGNEEGTPHFEKQADADGALAEIRRDDPESKASVRLLDGPCWVVQCDGECETVLDTEDEGYVFHHASLAEAGETVRAWEWVTVPATVAGMVCGGDLVYCEEDRPEGTEPPQPSPAEQEKAGQLRLPGVIA